MGQYSWYADMEEVDRNGELMGIKGISDNIPRHRAEDDARVPEN